MFKKVTYYLSLIMLILCVSVSFAWMLDIPSQIGHHPVLRFDDTISIASNDATVTVEIDEDGKYVSLEEKTTASGLYEVKNAAPGTVTKYRIVIKNNTDVELSMSIIFSEIKASLEEFYDHVYVGVFAADGFYFPYTSPEIKEDSIKDKLADDFVYESSQTEASIPFLTNFKVPDQYAEVVIRFYIRIDHEIGNEFQNQRFSIGKINFMMI